MAIDQAAVAQLIKECGAPAQNKGRRVWICDGGNMMAAINYFRQITGEEFDMTRLPTVASGFKLKTVTETIQNKTVR